MSTLVEIEKVRGVGVILFQCYDFAEDGTFSTRTLVGEKNCDQYNSKRIGYTDTFRIYPKASYDVYEQTNDHLKADLLNISYYYGSDSKKIIKVIDEKTFIVDDKVPVEYRVPTEEYPNGGEETAKGRVNDILKYIGWDHVDKPLDKIRYEGDCYTKIELLPECIYKLYSFKKVWQKEK